MYFLTEVSNQSHKIVSNCFNAQHKPVITHNHCNSNNIQMFNNREHINQKFRGDGLCMYPVSPNKFIVLNCKYHNETFLFNAYVEKQNIGYIEWSFYNPIEMPLCEIEF